MSLTNKIQSFQRFKNFRHFRHFRVFVWVIELIQKDRNDGKSPIWLNPKLFYYNVFLKLLCFLFDRASLDSLDWFYITFRHFRRIDLATWGMLFSIFNVNCVILTVATIRSNYSKIYRRITVLNFSETC